ncbi:MAG: CotH kinase family protein [Candidatus Omnitrophota bacterium]
MIIKDTNSRSLFLQRIKLFIKKPSKLKWTVLSVLVILMISGAVLSLIYYGMFLHQTRQALNLKDIFKLVRQSKLRIIPNYFEGLMAACPQISIDMKYIDYQKIAHKRSNALVNRIIITNSDDYVPANIQYDGKIVKAKIRLKGDWTDGLQGDKWSFRIKIVGENSLFGMKYLSIHHPRERNYIYEWAAHQALSREGVLVPRYKFIKIKLNGKNLGVYALEEHFDKLLIENNKSRQGLIIKFNEDILWSNRLLEWSNRLVDKNGHTEDGEINLNSVLSADIDSFKINKLFQNPTLYKQFTIAKNLLESFRKGSLSTHKVFDVEKLAKYLTLAEIMGGMHGAGIWHNLRFYYNPITSLLEPIAFDMNAGTDLAKFWEGFPARVMADPPDVFYAKLFDDLVFFEEYVKMLELISSKDYLDKLFLDIDLELKKNLRIIYSEFPYFSFSKDIIYRHQKGIQARLNPPKAMHAYFYKADDSSLELGLGNIQSLPIEVLGVYYKQSLLSSLSQKTILKSKIRNKPVTYRPISFSLPKNFRWFDQMITDLEVECRLLGSTKTKYVKVFPYSNLSDNFRGNDFMRQSPNINSFEFLLVDELAKTIFIKQGTWNITQNLIIPKGYKFICGEGVQLNILNSAKILSFSPIQFIGSQDNPIVIHSSDSTGQGITVINSSSKSVLEFVMVKNLSNSSADGWNVTGAVTFYESPVNIRNCQFLNSRSEDALNIIKSDFLIIKSFFNKALFDAVDIDFSQGQILESSFVDCGNDAIDISGSFVKINKIFIDEAGDKGLSVGEVSRMEAEKIEIQNSEVAVAVKDSSQLVIDDLVVTNCNIGLTAYQKKPEFGPGFITVGQTEMVQVKVPHKIEDGSRIEGKEHIK